jgi:aspartyl-tRNA(Asn)/glutamyl-tRNA(Gln) amidotransferase subunit A
VLGATSADLAAFLDAVASRPDPRDPLTNAAAPPPPGGFGALLGDGVHGLRIGIDERAFADGDQEIVARCREALGALEAEGARLVPIRIPLAAHAFAIGVATMGGEGTAITDRKDRARVAELSIDIRFAVDVARSISAGEFVDVQRLRAGLRRQTAAALANVDVIASPTTAVTAPLVSADEVRGVFADAELVRGICKHCFAANLTGLPALSVPVGVGAFGVPVGMQLTGDAWDEAALLAVSAHLERVGVGASIRPPAAFDLLD